MQSVARNTFYLTAGLIGQKLLSFIYFTVLARALGAEVIGKYSFALAFTTIFSVLTDLGLTQVLIREVARDKERAQEYVRTVLGIKLGLTVLGYAAAIFSARLLGHPRLTLELIALAGIVMALDAAHLTLYGVLRGFQILRFEAQGMVAGQAITLAFGAAALALHLPLHAFLFALALGSAWNVLYGYRQCRRYGISVLPHFHWPRARAIAKLALPFALSGIFVRVYAYIDTVMLQHIKGDAAVGFYSVPYKMTYAFQFIPIALSAAVYPALASASRQDKARLQIIFEQAIRYCMLLAFPIVLGIAALAPEIIRTLYTAAFAPSIAPLRASVFGLIFIFLYFPVGALLNATDRQTVNTACMGLTMVLNVALNLFLIPRFGPLGASIASVSTNAFLWLATFFWSLTIVRPSRRSARTLGAVLVASGVMALAVLQMKRVVFWPLAVPAGAVLYGILLYALRVVSRADLAAFTKLFRKQPVIEELIK